MNNDIFPEDVREAANNMGGDFIKAAEFEGAGLILQFAKPIEKITSNNPKYGAEEKDFLYKQELLEAGETFRYTFQTPSGKERKIDTKSGPFFIGIKQCEELGVGDWIRITRTGKTDKTRFAVEKVDAPAKEEYPQEELNSGIDL